MQTSTLEGAALAAHIVEESKQNKLFGVPFATMQVDGEIVDAHERPFNFTPAWKYLADQYRVVLHNLEPM